MCAMDLPEPVIRIAVSPKTTSDREKLAKGLAQLVAEDPTIRVQVEPFTGLTLVGGRGELHLSIVVGRLNHEFQVAADVGTPEVVYKEVLGEQSVPVRLEPVMRVEVTVPAEYAGRVVNDLLRRRPRGLSQDAAGGTRVVRTRVPLAEMLGYVNDLRSLTDGRATYSMRFDRYEPIGGSDPDAGYSSVSVPRPPVPTPRQSAVAVPEPDDRLPTA